MKLFPVFLDVAGRACLVAGGGRVGLDKARSLAAAGASVLVVDPDPSSELAREAESSGGGITVEARVFRASDCRDRLLVFACTGDAAADGDVASAARETGALCCRADGGSADFTTGAVLRRGDVCIAVSSGGTSPVLALEARDRAAGAVGEEFAEAAELLGGLRDRLRRDELGRSGVMNRDLVAGVLGALRGGRAAEARAFIEEAFASARTGAESGEGSCTR